MPDVHHLEAIELIKQAITAAETLKDIQTQERAGVMQGIMRLQSSIFAALGLGPEFIESMQKHIADKKFGTLRKNAHGAFERLAEEDAEKLELASRLAAIARGLAENWAGKSASEKQAALDQIGALKALIGDLAALAPNIAPEINALTDEIPTRSLDDVPADMGDYDDRSDVSSDSGYGSSAASEAEDNKSEPLPNKPNAEYGLYASTGDAISVSVKDNKTKLRIPNTEGMSIKHKVMLAESFVKTALLEGAFSKNAEGKIKFTLTSNDPQFCAAVKAQAKLWDCECNVICNDAGRDKAGVDEIPAMVEKYNRDLVREYIPNKSFTNQEGVTAQEALAADNKADRERRERGEHDPALREALIKSLLNIPSKERKNAQLSAIAEPGSLMKLFTSFSNKREEVGNQVLAERMEKSLADTYKPNATSIADTLASQGFTGYNYSASSNTEIQELQKNSQSKNFDLSKLQSIGIARAVAESTPKPSQTPTQG